MRASLGDEPTVICPGCGAQNRLAAPFCKHCGSRIYTAGAAPNKKNTFKRESKGRKAIRSVVRAFLFVVIVGMLGLAFWPYADVAVPSGRDPGRQMERYLAIVDRAMESGESLPLARFTQQNLNAYLGQNNNADENKLLGIIVDAPKAELIANEKIGPFNLSTRVVLKSDEETGEPEISHFWIGHLPLPGAMAKGWLSGLADRFGLEVDDAYWDHLQVQGIQRQSLYITFTP